MTNWYNDSVIGEIATLTKMAKVGGLDGWVEKHNEKVSIEFQNVKFELEDSIKKTQNKVLKGFEKSLNVKKGDLIPIIKQFNTIFPVKTVISTLDQMKNGEKTME